MESRRLRARLVERMVTSGALKRPEVETAFRSVPREAFLPGSDLVAAYADEPIVIKRDSDDTPISSSSQPSMMAIMLEQLELAPGHRVLEIGTGTGYNAALLVELVGNRGMIVSVDIDHDLVDGARENLVRAGYPDVRVVCADGACGYPPEAPYDRIIATVGVPDLLPAWSEQLAPGGRLVAPLDINGLQRSIAFERSADHWSSTSIVDCGFMRLRGPFAGKELACRLSGGQDLRAGGGDPDRPIDVDAIQRALYGPSTTAELDMTVTARDFFRGLAIWLAVEEPRTAVLTEGSEVQKPVLADARLRVNGTVIAPVVLAGNSIAVLVSGPSGRLLARGFGPDGAKLTATLLDHVRRWDIAGRPSGRDMHIDAYSRDVPVSGQHVMDKPHSQLVISWAKASN